MDDTTLLIEQMRVVQDELGGKTRAPMRKVIDDAIDRISTLERENAELREAKEKAEARTKEWIKRYERERKSSVPYLKPEA